MYCLFNISFFILGLVVGSFLNSVIYRIYKKESIFFPRSHCPYCNHKLIWKDLIPVLSFLILGGKCRYCKKPISLQYPLVELSTGFLFMFVFRVLLNGYFLPLQGICLSAFCFSFSLFYFLISTCFLIVIFIYDLKHYIIPDKIVYPAILVSGIWYLVSGIFFGLYTNYQILNAIYSCLGASLFFFLIWFLSRGKWIGFGDVKLVFFMGLFLGFPNILVALFLAFLIGAIIGLGFIFFKKKDLSSEIPFGPFLVTGTFIALFFGRELINWYLNFLNW